MTASPALALNKPQTVSGSFSASAVLIDCDLVKKRKAELQACSPADLEKMLGPSALDESCASVPLNELIAKRNAAASISSPVPSRPQTGSSTEGADEYDGFAPLNHLGREILANFLASPKQFRQFKSLAALGEYCGVSTETLDRWAHCRDVQRRVKALSWHVEVLAVLIARCEMPDLVGAVAEKAYAGDLRAFEILLELAESSEDRWPSLEGILAKLGTANDR